MNCGELIGEIFRARDLAHIAHLQSDGMAEHVVLEELYDALLLHADLLAELRLARGPMHLRIKSSGDDVDMVEYMEGELMSAIDDAKERFDENGYNDLSAEIDMVKTTVNKALYKLKNLTGKKGKKSGIEEYKNGGMFYGAPVVDKGKRPNLFKR